MDTQTIIEFKKPDLRSSITDVLEQRFSPRVFNEEVIKDDDLKSIFEAARWAPSSQNRQPWQFYFAKKGTPGFEKLVSFLLPGNEWAAKAPVLIAACYLEKDEMGDNSDAKYDLGLAVMSLITQVQSLSLYARQMGWFDKNKVAELLNLPETVKPQVMIAIGKIGDYSAVTDEVIAKKENQKRERKIDIACEVE